ncbi:PIR Superfamily Protein [Plasmodium ovale curtisi]|uniref:PIR Superfamily Protein n=1 Tax=Plasmodium ovale curtisi TaxID=864141 RepID=A0A1A8WQQ6_PLAOA|nr:PIR Superfamily Protein [Plasmodium ovale curtisi]
MTKKAGRKVIDKYSFCTNSPYYEELLKHVKNNKKKVDEENNCGNLSTSMQFSESEKATEICKEFKFLYKSFGTYGKEKSREDDAFSYYDYDFSNYWLNNKLRENVNDDLINVKEFYKQIISKNQEFFSKHEELEKHMNFIDPEILENMKLLYELYVIAVKIINIAYNKDYKPDELENEEQKIESRENEQQESKAQENEQQENQHQENQQKENQQKENQQKEKEENKPCSYYGEQLDKNYKEAMDRCLNSNVDYYNALKFFKGSYDFLTEMKPDELNTCKSNKFYYFPEYDAVLEKKANAIKISSTLLVLSFALPLIYKYTPFGPFLRAKIRMVKDRWLNPGKIADELLPLSTDIEDNISDKEEYNIGYYSETN